MHDTCLCGHGRSAHDHYRGGSDCASCADGQCRAFRADTIIGRLIDRLTGRRGQRSNFVDSPVGVVSVGQA